jgi:hypothetical protein
VHKAVIQLQTLVSDATNVQEMMVAAAGNQVLSMSPQVLGRQAVSLLTLRRIHKIGAVTYNSLTGKYLNSFTVEKSLNV